MNTAQEIIQTSSFSEAFKGSLLDNSVAVENIEAYPKTAQYILGISEDSTIDEAQRLFPQEFVFNTSNLEKLLSNKVYLEVFSDWLNNGIANDKSREALIAYFEEALLVTKSAFSDDVKSGLLQSKVALDNIRRDRALACVLLLSQGLELKVIEQYLLQSEYQKLLLQTLYPSLEAEQAFLSRKIKKHLPNLVFISEIKAYLLISIWVVAWFISLPIIQIVLLSFAYYSLCEASILLYIKWKSSNNKELKDSIKEMGRVEAIFREEIGYLKQEALTVEKLIEFLGFSPNFINQLSLHLKEGPHLNQIQSWLFPKNIIARLLEIITTQPFVESCIEKVGLVHNPSSEDQLSAAFDSNRKYGFPLLSREAKSEAIHARFFKPAQKPTKEVIPESENKVAPGV